MKFISGSEELRNASKDVEEIKFDVPFPQGSKAKILRRGMLVCHSTTSSCEFVLIPPDAVLSLN